MKTTKGETWVCRDGSPAVSGLALQHSLPERPARIVWESDYRKLMKLVRMMAEKRCEATNHPGLCGSDSCASCFARKLIGRKT